MIQYGDADAVVTGGAEATLTEFGFASFNTMQALSEIGISRPFDARRDGFMMGEGAGVLVLEEEEAREGPRREDPRGGRRLRLDLGRAPPDCARADRTPGRAGDHAGDAGRRRDPAEISYVNAHGTSTELNDASETAALKLALGEYAYKIPVSSTKSATGHLLGAAGAVEAVATLQALNARVVPPTLDYEVPDAASTSITCPARPANSCPPATARRRDLQLVRVRRPQRLAGDQGPRLMAGLLAGKRLLITGVITKDSIAFHVAQLAQAEGAEVLLTSFGRVRRDDRACRRSGSKRRWMFWNSTSTSRRISRRSRRSWRALGAGRRRPARDRVRARGCARRQVHDGSGGERGRGLPDERLFTEGDRGRAGSADADAASSIVGLDFDATVAWPIYDWMGVAKAALESVSRYLARDLGALGIRVNLVSAGPLGTVAARGIPGFEKLASLWEQQAPLGWDIEDPSVVAGPVCFLLSELSRGISGEIVHVDGGFHAIGAPPV